MTEQSVMLPHDYQLMMENKYSKQHIRSYIRRDIMECDEIIAKINICVVSIIKWANEDHYESKRKSLEKLLEIDIEDMIIDILALLLTSYPINMSFELTAAVGLVNNCLPYEDHSERIKRCGEILYHMANSDLMGMRPAYASPTGTITISNKYAIGGDTAKYIAMSRFNPPMVCEPKEIKSARDSGYLTKQSFAVLKRKHRHDEEINLVSLNKFAKVAFSLDIETLMLIEDELKPKRIKSKDKISENASTKNAEKKIQAFEELTLSTAEVCADLVKAGNRFHFVPFYCGRGRTYCRGYHVNMHGNSFRKSMLNFADAITMDQTSVEELRGFFEVDPVEL